MSFQRSLSCLARPAVRALGALALVAAVGSAQAFQAGFRTLTVAGPDAIPVALFYPTEAPARTVPMGPWSPQVAPGAPAVARFKGLILLSHGTGGSEIGHHNLASRLAQEGYLVAAPRHPRDDWQDRSLVRSGQYFGERARQASRVLDAVLADPAWAERIPAGRIGALGHSAGGYTVLALAVGAAEPARAGAHCRTVRDDPGFCQLGQLSAPGASAAPAAEAPREGPVQVGDPRVRAVLAMAPVGVVFSPEALAQVRRPVKVYTAEHDAVLNNRYHGQHVAGAVPGAQSENVKGAGHFAFMAAPQMSLRSDAGDPGEDPAGFDRAAFQTRLADDVVGFFNRSLP